VRANVIGRVRNIPLPRGQALLPLFEAVVNSIDAIEDAKRGADGRIEVYILRRDTLPLTTDDEGQALTPIAGFEVRDNGIGFTDENFRAFDEADTQFKILRGGKGVGRFLYLKAFSRVEVDSIFKSNGGFARRTFDFALSTDAGIENHKAEPWPDASAERTVVRLLDMREEYELRVPKGAKAIGRRMVEHCLEHFVLGTMPPVTIYEQGQDEPLNLKDTYAELVANSDKEAVPVKDKTFNVIHFMLHARADLGHHLSYCAARVKSRSYRAGRSRANESHLGL
jgi:hypothetical protein